MGYQFGMGVACLRYSVLPALNQCLWCFQDLKIMMEFGCLMSIKKKTMVLMIAGLFLLIVQLADAASTKTPFTSVSAQATYNALTAAGSTGVMLDTRTADEYYGCGQPWNSNNGVCTDPDAYNGTPKWVVSGVPDAVRLPFNIPYWYAGVVTGTGAPEDEAMVRSLIEELLAAGTINFNTEIYLLCRTAYRSYYMADWMDDQTFYNARTGTTEYFSKLINIDADGTPGGGQGGMQEWNAQGLPRWSNYGDKTMPPQIISYAPDKNGYTETVSNEVPFIVSILEPRLPGNSAISYSTVLNTCVGAVELPSLSTTDLCDTTDTPANTLITHYNLTLTLSNGNYLWTSGSENYHPSLGSLQQTSPNATYAGHDTRNLTVDVIVACADNDNDTYSPDGGDCGLVDCDDNNDTVFPGADDSLCNGIDNNCDGVVDEGYTSSSTSCGVGICASLGLLECVNGGEVDSCVAGTPDTEGPFGDATCSDGIDNDCDGAIDIADSDCVVCTDNDGDGYFVEGGDCGTVDCDDSDTTVNTGATEGPPGDPTCIDAKDNDCDGWIDSDDSDCQDSGRRMHHHRGHGGG